MISSCKISRLMVLYSQILFHRLPTLLLKELPTQSAKVYRATSRPTHYSIAARWWLPSTALWRGCNSADEGSDVALTPTDRRRPANGPTYYMFFNKQLISYTSFFHVNYSSTVHLRDWVGPVERDVHLQTLCTCLQLRCQRRLSI